MTTYLVDLLVEGSLDLLVALLVDGLVLDSWGDLLVDGGVVVTFALLLVDCLNTCELEVAVTHQPCS